MLEICLFFAYAVVITIGATAIDRITDMGMRAFFLKCFPIYILLLVVPGYWAAGHAVERVESENATEISDIATNPQKWLSGRIGDTADLTVGGILLVIDEKIGEIRETARHSDRMEVKMECGRAIEALEKRKECVRKFGSPMVCG